MKLPGLPLMAAAIVTVTAVAWGLAPSSAADTEQEPDAETGYLRPDEDELRNRLTRLQFEVTQNEATERPFQNEYWDNKVEGIYVDVVSGEPLFSSTDKFSSGTGWPSFTRPISSEAVTEHDDTRFFVQRTELKSRLAGSHLGHVFTDGPQPTGLRYCINSAALRFVPRDRLAEEGYGDFLGLFAQQQPGPDH